MKRSYYQPVIIFIFLIIIFSLNEKDVNYPFLKQMPSLFIIILSIYELYLSFSLFSFKSKFSTSILLISLIFPCQILSLISIRNKSSRFSKIDLFTKMMMTLAYIFITFLRWPFKEITVTNEEEHFNNDENNTILDYATNENNHDNM